MEGKIELLISLHKDSARGINWNHFINRPEPLAPVKSHALEMEARAQFEKYKPNFFSKIFGIASYRNNKFEKNIFSAKRLDEKHNSEQAEKYLFEHREWKVKKTLGERLYNFDIPAYIEVFAKFNDCKFLWANGKGMNFFFEGNALDVELLLNKKDIIPKSVKTQLPSGKSTEKDLPNPKLNLVYQEHVCSAVLRAARECFALFPIDMIVISAVCDGRPINGSIKQDVILSLQIPRLVLERANFISLDPVDFVKSFSHSMNFSIDEGFEPCEKVMAKKIAA